MNLSSWSLFEGFFLKVFLKAFSGMFIFSRSRELKLNPAQKVLWHKKSCFNHSESWDPQATGWIKTSLLLAMFFQDFFSSWRCFAASKKNPPPKSPGSKKTLTKYRCCWGHAEDVWPRRWAFSVGHGVGGAGWAWTDRKTWVICW